MLRITLLFLYHLGFIPAVTQSIKRALWIADYVVLNDRGRLTKNKLDKKKPNSVRAAQFLVDFFAVIAVKAAYKQRRQ